jgi:hypothetical protein
MYITIEKLRRRGACLSQQVLFLKTFPEHEYPNGVEVTLDTCLRHSQDFEFVWAADHFLRGEARFNFFKAEEEAFAVSVRVGDVLRPLRRAQCYYYVVTAQLFFEGIAAMEVATTQLFFEGIAAIEKGRE